MMRSLKLSGRRKADGLNSKRLLPVLLVLMFILLLTGCRPANTGKEGNKIKVRLLVTINYGSETLYRQELAAQAGQTVLDLMQKNLHIETDYGGAFIKTINKVGTQPQQAWFLYVNGITTDKGAGDYRLEGGETIWWDYHPWENTALVPAVIGSYPQPFKDEYAADNQRIQILYTPMAEEQSQSLGRTFKLWGTADVTVKPLKSFEPALQRTQPTVLLGLTTELQAFPESDEMASQPLKTGIFCRWQKDSLIALDGYGNQNRQFGRGSGCVVATGTGLGDRNPLWLVLGTDTDGLDRAVKLLQTEPPPVEGHFGLIVTGDGITRLPMGS